MTIVSYDLQQAQGVNLSKGYIEQADPNLENLSNSLQVLGKAYTTYQESEDKAEKARRATEYEQELSQLVEAAENSDMPESQKVVAYEKLNVKYADVPASERNSIDGRHTRVGVAQDLYKKREEAELQNQLDYEKILDKQYQEKFPASSANMSSEERVREMKRITFLAGAINDVIKDPSLASEETYADFVRELELTDIRNWVSEMSNTAGDNAKMSTKDLAQAQYMYTSKLTDAGVDLRVASLATEMYFKPFIAVAEKFNKSAEVSLKAMNNNVTLNMNATARYWTQNKELIPFLSEEMQTSIMQELAKNTVPDDSSGELFSTKEGSLSMSPQSFKYTFTTGMSAKRTDGALEALVGSEVLGKGSKQRDKSLTDSNTPSFKEMSQAMENASAQDRLNAMANNRAILQSTTNAYNEWSQSTDPDVKKAITDRTLEELQKQLAYGLGAFIADSKGFLTDSYQLKWVMPGEIRVYDEDGEDITKGFGATYFGFGNPQKQLQNNIAAIQEAVKVMYKGGMLTPQDISNGMNAVIDEVVGQDGRFESVGYAEDIGGAVLKADAAIQQNPLLDLAVALAFPSRAGSRLTEETLKDMPQSVKNSLAEWGRKIAEQREVPDDIDEDDADSFAFVDNEDDTGAAAIAQHEGTGKYVYIDEIGKDQPITTPYGFNLTHNYFRRSEEDRKNLEKIAPRFFNKIKGKTEEEIREMIESNPRALSINKREAKALSEELRLEAVTKLPKVLGKERWSSITSELQDQLTSAWYQRGQPNFLGSASNNPLKEKDKAFIAAIKEARWQDALDIAEEHPIYGKRFETRYSRLRRELKKMAEFAEKGTEIWHLR